MLTIQIGQCGNQLGHSLFSLLSTETNPKNSNSKNLQHLQESQKRWFSGYTKAGKLEARAILVDTEKKVIDKIQVSPNWAYGPSSLVYQSSGGSANNWAYGYSVRGPEMESQILNSVQLQVEKSDNLHGILVLQSSAGGTGSGVGCYTLEKLADEFPTKTIVSSVILPFTSGEVATQNYNSLLTLAKLSEFVDLALVFENKQIHSICTNALKNQEAQLKDINDVISGKLAAVFTGIWDVWDVVNFASSHPGYKFASVKSVPYVAASIGEFESSFKWRSLGHQLKQTLRVPLVNGEQLVNAETKSFSYSMNNSASHAFCKSVANVLVTRGPRSHTDPLPLAEFKDENMYATWLCKRDKFTHFHQDGNFIGQEKFAALLTNNSLIHKPIDAIVDKAWTAYVHSAFLHQYKKFGMEDDDFLRAFAKVENVIMSYKNLS